MRRENLVIEDARLIFKNFTGREERSRTDGRVVNMEGTKKFGVIVPEDIVDQLVEDGWNVKILAPREEGDEPAHYLSVNISDRFFTPKITMYTKRNSVDLNMETCGQIDYADIISADVVLEPASQPGRNPYLRDLRVVIQESRLDEKYADYFGPEDE